MYLFAIFVNAYLTIVMLFVRLFRFIHIRVRLNRKYAGIGNR